MVLLVVLVALVAVGVIFLFRRGAKADPIEENPMRGTTRRDKGT